MNRSPFYQRQPCYAENGDLFRNESAKIYLVVCWTMRNIGTLGRLWLINGPDSPEFQLPLCPRKQTLSARPATSEKCPEADVASIVQCAEWDKQAAQGEAPVAVRSSCNLDQSASSTSS